VEEPFFTSQGFLRHLFSDKEQKRPVLEVQSEEPQAQLAAFSPSVQSAGLEHVPALHISPVPVPYTLDVHSFEPQLQSASFGVEPSTIVHKLLVICPRTWVINVQKNNNNIPIMGFLSNFK
jgi:hypothetical protein